MSEPTTVTIADYGLGNIHAFLNVFKRLNIPARRATSVAELQDATRLILPGVGHFDHAMRELNASGMRDALDDLVLQRRVPVLGVCVGMQMLGHGSDEGTEQGLGWIDGHVHALGSRQQVEAIPLPHMGWNDVRLERESPLLKQLEQDARFYFLHSFYFECARPEDVVAVADYGGQFGCVVGADNVYGVQFHPEKSHHFGTRLLQNFAEM
jgi:imidazole glycerol-phosphate synthase subunit HisH